ncbi:MAG: BMP family ABC transporter substrate-binding protein [Anaerolineae bacterium]
MLKRIGLQVHLFLCWFWLPPVVAQLPPPPQKNQPKSQQLQRKLKEAPATEEAKAPATEAAKAEGGDSEGKYQIPAIEEGKYNVAFVYVGPHDDGGWTQAHDVGREYVEANVENVHTAYVENVAEGADAEQVIRSLARKGFNVIFTTSFGFMDASEAVANEFPDVNIIHLTASKPTMRTLATSCVLWRTSSTYLRCRLSRQAGWQPQVGLYRHLPHPRRVAPGQRLCPRGTTNLL